MKNFRRHIDFCSVTSINPRNCTFTVESFRAISGIFLLLLSSCQSDPCYRGEFKTVHHSSYTVFLYPRWVTYPPNDSQEFNCIETASQHLRNEK
jgi:hypothetical protein